MIKKNVFWNILVLIIFVSISCTHLNNRQNRSQTIVSETTSVDRDHVLESVIRDAHYYKKKGYQVFEEYEFAIKAPCKLKDVSMQVEGDFVLNYGGVENENNPSKIVFYQLMLSRLPAGFRDVPENELKSKVDSKLKVTMKQFKNVRSVSYGYEGYPGYVGETTFKGYNQKGVIFLKENYIFALTIITNNDLESNFNKFTNSMKFINTQNIQTKIN